MHTHVRAHVHAQDAEAEALTRMDDPELKANQIVMLHKQCTRAWGLQFCCVIHTLYMTPALQPLHVHHRVLNLTSHLLLHAMDLPLTLSITLLSMQLRQYVDMMGVEVGSSRKDTVAEEGDPATAAKGRDKGVVQTCPFFKAYYCFKAPFWGEGGGIVGSTRITEVEGQSVESLDCRHLALVQPISSLLLTCFVTIVSQCSSGSQCPKCQTSAAAALHHASATSMLCHHMPKQCSRCNRAANTSNWPTKPCNACTVPVLEAGCPCRRCLRARARRYPTLTGAHRQGRQGHPEGQGDGRRQALPESPVGPACSRAESTLHLLHCCAGR
eukprot:1156762-Pelagomonas_calceolata.AAC.2